MCPVHGTGKRLQCPPLGAVTPPNGKTEAGYRGSSVYQTFHWDALYAEQA